MLEILPKRPAGAAESVPSFSLGHTWSPAAACEAALLQRALRVGLASCEARLRGEGEAAGDGLVADGVTAPLALVGHWCRHRATLEDGRVVTPGLVRILLHEEATQLREERVALGLGRDRFAAAEARCAELVLAARPVESVAG